MVGDTSAHAGSHYDTAWETQPFHLSTSSLRSVKNTIDIDVNELPKECSQHPEAKKKGNFSEHTF